MNQMVVTGIILSTSPIGEYDRRVVLLTKELGKISAFAKGARRPNSPMVGMVNPFSFGDFTIYVGRSSYTIQSVKISNYFSDLREDMEAAYYGFYFLEVTDYVSKEGNEEREMLRLLYQSLRALSSAAIPNELIRYIFELKVFCIQGMAPQLSQCVVCQAHNPPADFSVSKGGLLCVKCNTNPLQTISLDGSTLYTLQYIVGSTVEKLYSFTVSTEVLRLLKKVMQQYSAMYMDKQFKSLDILQTLC